MGKFFDEIPEKTIKWIEEQHCFWVATAPLSPDGHVNVSPKGIAGTFKALDKNTVMYQDLSGSGSETIAHLRENGRITIMFQEFSEAAQIIRLYGTGTWHEVGTAEFKKFIPDNERLPGGRAVIIVNVHAVGSSCGYAVPIYTFCHHRTQLLSFFDNKEKFDNYAMERTNLDCKSDKGIWNYWALKNAASIDGLPAMETGLEVAKHQKVDIYALKPFVSKGKRNKYTFNLGEVLLPRGTVKSTSDSIMIAFGFIVGVFAMAMYNHFSG